LGHDKQDDEDIKGNQKPQRGLGVDEDLQKDLDKDTGKHNCDRDCQQGKEMIHHLVLIWYLQA
jgi:hypothetical protein